MNFKPETGRRWTLNLPKRCKLRFYIIRAARKTPVPPTYNNSFTLKIDFQCSHADDFSPFSSFFEYFYAKNWEKLKNR